MLPIFASHANTRGSLPQDKKAFFEGLGCESEIVKICVRDSKKPRDFEMDAKTEVCSDSSFSRIPYVVRVQARGLIRPLAVWIGTCTWHDSETASRAHTALLAK